MFNSSRAVAAVVPLLLGISGCESVTDPAPLEVATPRFDVGITYTATNLGTLGSGMFASSFANAINNSAVIVGGTSVGFGTTTHAFRYAQGTMTDLGVLNGYIRSVAEDINAGGKIVGYSWAHAIDSVRAFTWDNVGGMQALPQPVPGAATWAYGINADGFIAGAYKTGGVTRALLWFNNGATLDLHPAGADSSRAYDVNKTGTLTAMITGVAWFPGGVVRGFMVTSGGLSLNYIGGASGWAKAVAINDSNRVVGIVRTSPITADAFHWKANAGFTYLGVMNPGIGWDISSKSRIVGQQGNYPDYGYGFTWRAGTQTLLHALSGDAVAMGVNSCGLIVGKAKSISGATRAILWTPSACD